MITLHIAKHLADNGLGTLALTGTETGSLIFWEKLPINKVGVFIMSNGDPMAIGKRQSQSFDIMARGTSDVDGNKRLKAIMDFIGRELHVCELPIVTGVSTTVYADCLIQPTFNITNQGLDSTDRIIWSASFKVIYKEN